MLKTILFLTLCMVLFFFVNGINSAIPCTLPPSPAKTEQNFKLMIESADHIFLAKVSYVLKQRWSNDDTRPNFHPKWLELAAKAPTGEDVGSKGYIVNWVEFAKATAYLSIDTELFWSGLTNSRHVSGTQNLIPIDLLRPFTVAGHGPCNSFPQTCPWDISIGDTLALAVQKNNFGAYKALICQRIPRLTNDKREKIRRNNKSITKYNSIRSFLTLPTILSQWK